MKSLNYLCLLFVLNSAFASDVVVETDFNTGRGILRSVGQQCLVYTPKHVVENSDGIYISSPHVKEAKSTILTEYPQDLAILQLAPEYQSMCSSSSWRDDGNRVRSILNGVKDAVLSFRKKSGSFTEYQLIISSKDLHTYFYVELKSANRQFMQGMSGSIVKVGEYPVGMLISVKDNIGKVLRLDTIANISKSVVDSFLSDIEVLAQNSKDLGAYKSINNNKGNTAKPKQINSGKWIFSGNITEGQTITKTIIAKGNTAYRLTSKKQSKSVRVGIDFISPSEKVIKDDDFYTGKDNYTFGYGATDEGEYEIRITGIKGDIGTYHFTLEEAA
ncbi:MAG: hypothetical protein COA59_06700, partial [Colwellia sp.]